jgi:hypothetical protein
LAAAGAGGWLGELDLLPADDDPDEADDGDGECAADDEEPPVGSGVVAGELAADELAAELDMDEPAADELAADEPPASAASGFDPPPLEHPATARTAAATTTRPRIAPPLTPDTAMLTAAARKELGIGHPT